MIKWLAVKLPSEIPGRKREELLARLPLERKIALEKSRADGVKKLGPLFAYALLRYAMGGEAPRIEWKSGEKPAFAGDNGLYFSLSHTEGLVLCALSDSPCGTDCERIREVNGKVWQRTLSENELLWANNEPKKLFMLWSLKESFLKLSGKGLSLWPGKIEFSFDGERPISPEAGVFSSCTALDGFSFALCSRGEEVPQKPEFVSWEDVIEY